MILVRVVLVKRCRGKCNWSEFERIGEVGNSEYR